MSCEDRMSCGIGTMCESCASEWRTKPDIYTTRLPSEYDVDEKTGVITDKAGRFLGMMHKDVDYTKPRTAEELLRGSVFHKFDLTDVEKP